MFESTPLLNHPSPSHKKSVTSASKYQKHCDQWGEVHGAQWGEVYVLPRSLDAKTPRLTISALLRLLHAFRPVKRNTFEQRLNLATHLRTF